MSLYISLLGVCEHADAPINSEMEYSEGWRQGLISTVRGMFSVIANT